ncbi:putative molybdenum carrier protein [Draconibacterium sp. IB214405]|uniref:putative molybdenum carrier protein n=1 Tax=Draconibacterium sp. IB214405 TaxID=3097352 RepID=UPI002A164C5E|nr:putative molybdenum carrier protein [Draconibacterium sp. IB214405]MDX8338525.1 putative molybdenum carrier protein [Draconibacterium sp. IB214405]
MTTTKLQIPCQKIISGGQTGVDRAVLDACLQYSFPCGGWCPKNRKAEDGKIPDLYPLEEMEESEYKARTRKNVIEADGTLILAPEKLQGGTFLTKQFSIENNKPVRIIRPETNPDKLLIWIIINNISVLNIAGPRQSEWSEAYSAAYRFTTELIVKIKFSASDIQP